MVINSKKCYWKESNSCTVQLDIAIAVLKKTLQPANVTNKSQLLKSVRLNLVAWTNPYMVAFIVKSVNSRASTLKWHPLLQFYWVWLLFLSVWDTGVKLTSQFLDAASKKARKLTRMLSCLS